jgi:hypothetical protein
MATTITHNSPVTKAAVGAGETSEPIYTPAECVIACTPGDGGSMLAQATWSLRADVEAGNANWHDWDEGTVTDKATQLLLRATAVRFTATTEDGVGEVAR